MKNPLVSIIIVVKNEERYLPSLFRLIEKQTYRNIEVIVIDNGSTDDTPRIIESYIKDSSYPVKTGTVSGTLAQAYNKALDLANGDYIAIIAGDELPSKVWVEEHVKYLLQRGCDACLAPVVYIAKNRENTARWYFNRSILEILFNRLKTSERILFNTGNVSFRAEAIKKVRFYDPMTVSEDGEMSYRFVKHGFKLCYNEKAIVFHPAPSSFRHHISFWWKLAYANKALTDVHPYLDLKKIFFRHILLSHFDPREWVKSSLWRKNDIAKSILLHITAFITLLTTFTCLKLTHKKILWKYIQRIKE